MLTISEIAMRKIFTEDEVNLDSLQAHFLDSGFTIENPKNSSFGVRSVDGLYIVIRLDEQKVCWLLLLF
jgi:hypothetical protein